MPFAPKTRSPADQGGNRASTKSAAGKRAQRERNGNATSSGSSGAAKKLKDYPEVDWSTVEDEVEHVTDISGKIVQSQLGAGGYYTMLVAVPKEYAPNALLAALKSQESMMYMRFYTVPLRFFEPPEPTDDEGGD